MMSSYDRIDIVNTHITFIHCKYLKSVECNENH